MGVTFPADLLPPELCVPPTAMAVSQPSPQGPDESLCRAEADGEGSGLIELGKARSIA